jgi:hypothetical protein
MCSDGNKEDLEVGVDKDADKNGVDRIARALALLSIIIPVTGLVNSVPEVITLWVGLLTGPDVVLSPSKPITITMSDVKPYLSVHAGTTYYNRGSIGYNDIITDQTLRLRIDGTEVRRSSQGVKIKKSHTIDLLAAYYEDVVTVKGEALTVSNRSTANPLLVKAQDFVYKETYFHALFPRTPKPDDPNAEIKSFLAKYPELQISITFGARTLTKAKVITHVCGIKVKSKSISRFLKRKQGWTGNFDCASPVRQ